MTTEQEKIIAERMQPIRLRYLQNLRNYQQELGVFLESSHKAPLSLRDCQCIRDLVHKAIGSGTIFGFPEVTAAGSLLEARLDASSRADDEFIRTELKHFLAVCQSVTQ